MMQVQHHIGRLAEVRYRAPLTVDELFAFITQVRAIAESDDPNVFCCDWREIDVFEPTFFDTLVWTMRRDNATLIANGILISPDKPRVLEQVTRILKDAHSDKRRVVTTRADLARFLDPHLTLAERRRRDEFLDGIEPRESARRLPRSSE